MAHPRDRGRRVPGRVRGLLLGNKPGEDEPPGGAHVRALPCRLWVTIGLQAPPTRRRRLVSSASPAGYQAKW